MEKVMCPSLFLSRSDGKEEVDLLLGDFRRELHAVKIERAIVIDMFII